MNGTTRLTLSMGFLPILLSGSDIRVERWDVHKLKETTFWSAVVMA